MVFDYLSEKDSFFIISTSILMLLSPNPLKIITLSGYLQINSFIIFPNCEKCDFQKVSSLFEPLCTFNLSPSLANGTNRMRPDRIITRHVSIGKVRVMQGACTGTLV